MYLPKLLIQFVQITNVFLINYICSNDWEHTLLISIYPLLSSSESLFSFVSQNNLLSYFANILLEMMFSSTYSKCKGRHKKKLFFFQKNSEILRPAIRNGRVFSDKEISELARPPPPFGEKFRNILSFFLITSLWIG